MNMLPTPPLARNLDPNRPDANLALLSTPADLGDVIGASAGMAWDENLGPKIWRAFNRSLDFGPHLTPDELNERFPRPDGTPWATSMPERSARQVWELENRRYRANRTLARGPGGALQTAAEFGTGIAVSFADPVNLAASLIPFVGEARMAQLVARYGVTRARLVAGAIDGSLGNLAAEGLNIPLSLEEGQDYGAAQVIYNLTAGALFGATFHATGGKIMDFMSRGKHTRMLAEAAAAVDLGRPAPVHELLALDPDIVRAELYAGRTLNERQRVVALEHRDAFLGKVNEADVEREVARRTARFIEARENPQVADPATLLDPTQTADTPRPTSRTTSVTFDDAADDDTFADALAADADRMAREDGIETNNGSRQETLSQGGVDAPGTTDSNGSPALPSAARTNGPDVSGGLDDLQQIAQKLGAKTETVDADTFHKRSGSLGSPAFFDPATSSIVLRSDLFEALPPSARRKVLEEEVIHLATRQAYQAKHAASGSTLSFNAYYSQELRALWEDVAATPQGRELVTKAISSYYGRKLESPLTSIDEVLALTGGNPIPLMPELIRAGVQLRKDGIMTEAAYQGFLGKIVQFLEPIIARMREILDAEYSPLLADAIKRTEAILDAARTGDPAKLPAQMELRLSDTQGTQGAPPIADYIKPLTEWFKNPLEVLRLPSIPARIAKALGTPEKPVILKPNILQKNLAAHPDLTPEMSAQILQETINRPTQIIQGKPTSKPNYRVFIKKDSPNKISVLEVSEAKEGIEIVGWRMGNDKAVARIEKNARKEGGQVLIEGDFSPTAADLSDFQPDTTNISPDTGRVNFAPAINDPTVPLHARLRDNLLPAQRQKIREARATYQALKADPAATPEQRLEAAAAYRQAVTQHRALSNAIRQIEAAPDPATALDALIDGRNNLFTGARLGIAQLQSARFLQAAGSLDAKLRQLGLTQAFAKGDIDDLLADALFQLTTPGGKTHHLPTPIVELAQHITALQNRLTGQANALGATIGSLPGRIARQSHNPDKIRRAGLAAWKEQILPLLDPRTFAKVQDPDAFLTQIYHNLVSGLHLQDLGAQAAIPTRSTSNLANSLGAHRKLHFKDAASWLAYQRAFGEPNLAASILADFQNLSAAAAAIEKLGPNPTHTLNLLATNIEAALQQEPEKLQAFQSKRATIEKFLDYQLGKLNRPTHPTLARLSAGIRAWQSLARLGGVVLTSISDLAGFNAEARYQGLRNPFAGYLTALESLTKRMTDAERTEFASLLGAGIEGTLGAIHARFDTAEPLSTGMSRAQQTFFRLTGLTYWTDALKSGAALMTSHHLALHAHKDFASLPHQISRLLNLYGISPSEWDLLRAHTSTGPDGRSYLLPADIDSRFTSNTTLINAATKLQALISDRTDFAVLSAGSRERFTLLNALGAADINAGPLGLWGQAARFLTQFKSFSVATITKTLSRDIQGSSSTSEAAISVSAFLAQTIILGYLAMTLKDLIRGKNPRDPRDPKTFLAAFMQSGGLGIYGDFLFSAAQENRLGRGLLETMGGPTISSLADLKDILKHSYNYATGNRDNLPAAQALRLTLQNTPFLNLFYTRTALDYLILHNLQELASPGYLKRLEKRLLEDEGRTYWLPPTQSLQPLGTP